MLITIWRFPWRNKSVQPLAQHNEAEAGWLTGSSYWAQASGLINCLTGGQRKLSGLPVRVDVAVMRVYQQMAYHVFLG